MLVAASLVSEEFLKRAPLNVNATVRLRLVGKITMRRMNLDKFGLKDKTRRISVTQNDVLFSSKILLPLTKERNQFCKISSLQVYD